MASRDEQVDLSATLAPGSGASTPTARHGGAPITAEEPSSMASDDSHASLPELTAAEQSQVLDLTPLTVEELHALDADVIRAIGLFFSNDFDGAETIMQSRAHQDALYALGEGTFAMLRAMTTFNADDIANATTLLQRAEALAAQQLKLATPRPGTAVGRFGKWIKGAVGLGGGTRLNAAQLRSTIVRAEASLICSFLYLFQESIMAFVKAGLGLRRSQNAYANAWRDYQAYLAEAGGNMAALDSNMDANTREGVQFGIGSLNVVLSILPNKVARVISIFGYKGDKKLGYDLLELAAAGDGVRAPIAQLFMGGYHAVLSSFAPQILGPSMLPLATRHLLSAPSAATPRYPNSPFHLLLLARAARSARDLPRSNALLVRAAAHARAARWPELAFLAEYERALNLMGMLEWRAAGELCRALREGTYWSPAFFAYAESACWGMLDEEDHARECLALAPGFVTRTFGGKVPSAEQWVLKKCDVWKARGGRLVEGLPGLEILLIWNMYPTMQQVHLIAAHELLSDALDARASEADPDTLAPLFASLAAIERERGDWEAATRALDWIAENEADIKVETWVPPLGAYMRGVVVVGQAAAGAAASGAEDGWGGKLREAVAEATTWMNKAGKYSDFCFEFRLAFRIYLVSIQLDEWLAAGDALTPSMMRMPSAEDLFGKAGLGGGEEARAGGPE